MLYLIILIAVSIVLILNFSDYCSTYYVDFVINIFILTILTSKPITYNIENGVTLSLVFKPWLKINKYGS